MGRKRSSLDFRISPENCHQQQIEIPSDEEDEANEDLSLGILAKAKRNKAVVLEIISSDEDERPAGPAVRTLDESNRQTNDNDNLYNDDHTNNNKDGGYTCVESSGDKKRLENEKIEVLETDFVSADITPGSVCEIQSRKKKKKRRKNNQILNLSTPEVTGTGTQEVAENMAIQKLLVDDHNQNLNLSTLEVADTQTKVVDNAVMRKLLRGPRYFDPQEEQEQLCYNCGEPGHISVNCTVERRKKPCYVCGNLGHGARGCLQATECYICKKVGHIAKNCTEQRPKGDKKGHNFAICLRCGDTGHDMASCQKGYNAEDMKQIQCYVCKSFGHLCCIDVMDNCTREDSCYNCGEKGHTGMGCAKERRRKGGEGPAKTCFKCGEEGHFARGCRRDANLGRWTPDVANLGNEWLQDDADLFGFRSVPRDFGKAHRWADMESDLRKASTPGDFGSRKGWKRKFGDLKGTPQRMNTWDSPAGNLDFGGCKMGSSSNDQRTTSKMSRGHSSFSPNGSHHSYGFHNKYDSSNSKKRDGWKRSH